MGLGVSGEAAGVILAMAKAPSTFSLSTGSSTSTPALFTWKAMLSSLAPKRVAPSGVMMSRCQRERANSAEPVRVTDPAWRI